MTTNSSILYRGGRVFDGQRLLEGYGLVVDSGIIKQLDQESELASADKIIDIKGDIISPGYVDLQVNGGGGVMFNDEPSLNTLKIMERTHRKLGVSCFLPTLISDDFVTCKKAINAVLQAIRQGTDTIGGLHLEGPHLSIAKKGAHNAKHIRRMVSNDLKLLIDAALQLPSLMLTIAPENVTLEQVARLKDAGAILSLGHSNANYSTCMDYVKAGVSCVTHLFNAMSQLGNREPGLVGTALDCANLSVGLIADGIHVHPASIRAALTAKLSCGGVFLVSDAMAIAGTDIDSFYLNDRKVIREEGRLTIEDGTLAGADIDLTKSLSFMIKEVGASVEESLKMVTSIPARVAGLDDKIGRLPIGSQAPLIRIDKDFSSCFPLNNTSI